MAYRSAHPFTATSAQAPLGIFIHDDANPRVSVLHVFGELSFANAGAFEAAFNGVADQQLPVTIALSECTFMDCAAIGVLVRALKRLGPQLSLVVPPESQAHRLLELTDMLPVFTRAATLEDDRNAADVRNLAGTIDFTQRAARKALERRNVRDALS